MGIQPTDQYLRGVQKHHQVEYLGVEDGSNDPGSSMWRISVAHGRARASARAQGLPHSIVLVDFFGLDSANKQAFVFIHVIAFGYARG